MMDHFTVLPKTLQCFPITHQIKSRFLPRVYKALHDLPPATSLPSFSKQLVCVPSLRLLHLPICLLGMLFRHLPAWLIHALQFSAQVSPLQGGLL